MKTGTLITFVTLAAALALSVLAATLAAGEIERRSTAAVSGTLAREGMAWAQVTADGLEVEIAGIAPDEAARFRALSVAAQVVDSGRLTDTMSVAAARPPIAPRFGIEVLRSAEGVVLAGLMPEATDHRALMERVARAAYQTPITDLLETADHPAPPGWNDALAYALDALARMESAKLSIAPGRVAIETIAPDRAARETLVRELELMAPAEVALRLDVAAPRPILTPFPLRAVREGDGLRLEACAAASEAAAERILDAARKAGAGDDARCSLALGSPSPAWTDMAVAALDTLAQTGGILSVADLDVALEAPADLDAARLEAAEDRLAAALPSEFALSVIRAADPEAADDAPDFAFEARRVEGGSVRLSGRIGSARARDAALSVARAVFGADAVTASLQITPDAPARWGPRVLATIDALSLLAEGRASLTATEVTVTGVSGNADAPTRIAALLNERAGDGLEIAIDVTYDEARDPTLGLPTGPECVERANKILAARQITFAPGSSTIDEASRDSVDAIAEILTDCGKFPIEVAGYTDSQGREEMNRALSQSRAEAVIAALLARRVPVVNLTPVGYGEEDPIADNATEAGREANRRIAFTLVSTPGADPDADADPEADADANTDPDAGSDPDADAATDATANTDADTDAETTEDTPEEPQP